MSSSDQTTPAASHGVGERLRKARTAAGLSVADVAARLRMQLRVVEALESEDWGRLGAPVFVRGQLRSYLRLLALPLELADTAASDEALAPPELTPRTFTPPMQRLMERTMGRAVYVVVTALIAVPVWVATRPHVEDGHEVETALMSLESGGISADPSRPLRPTTVTASLGALPKRFTTPSVPVPEMPEPSPSGLLLRFNGDSWLDVRAPSGEALEQALVRKGEVRRFQAGSIGSIKLGDADAVEVLRDGDVQDLSRFRRASVARFTVSSDGALAPVSE